MNLKSLLLFLLLPCALIAKDLTSVEADRFLDQLAEERGGIPGVEKRFREEKMTSFNARPVISEGIIAFQSPDSFRREITGENASITTSNGDKLWLYYPALKEVELYNLKDRGPVKASISAMLMSLSFKDLRKNFRYEIQQDENGWKITLQPKSRVLRRMFTQMNITLDAQRLVSRLDLLNETGDKISTTFWDEKVKKFPDHYFIFNVPTDAHVSTPLGN